MFEGNLIVPSTSFISLETRFPRRFWPKNRGCNCMFRSKTMWKNISPRFCALSSHFCLSDIFIDPTHWPTRRSILLKRRINGPDWNIIFFFFHILHNKLFIFYFKGKQHVVGLALPPLQRFSIIKFYVGLDHLVD